MPGFGASEAVYERYVLLRSWLALREKGEVLHLPADIEPLVESVYGPEQASPGGAWAEALASARERMEAGRDEAERLAAERLVAAPTSPLELVEAFNARLEEDEDPEVHAGLRAATRLGDPSLRVACLAETAPGDFIPIAGGESVDLDREPDLAQTRALLASALSLSHRGLYHALLRDAVPVEWRTSPHLRYHRALVFVDGHCRVGSYGLTANAELGLIIEKEEP